jgi:zona occludens toxin (predicted ATPase)
LPLLFAALLKSLLSTFDLWFLWVNLFFMFIYGCYGVYSKPETAPRREVFVSLEHERSSFTIAYMSNVILGAILQFVVHQRISLFGNLSL